MKQAKVQWPQVCQSVKILRNYLNKATINGMTGQDTLITFKALGLLETYVEEGSQPPKITELKESTGEGSEGSGEDASNES